MTVLYATKTYTTGLSVKDKRKKERQVSRQLLYFAVQQEYDFAKTELEFSIEEGGKPYFIGYPVHFNYSHSAEYAVVALSDTPVGVDIEHFERAVSPRLLERTLATGLLQAHEVSGLAPINVWTRYEAAYKMGHSPSLRHFREYDLDGYIISVCSEIGGFSNFVNVVELSEHLHLF